MLASSGIHLGFQETGDSQLATQEVFGTICSRVCEEEGWELLPTGVRVTFGDGRHQLVQLEFFEFENEELVRLYTTIGDARELSAVRLTTALRINAELAHGALGVRYDHLIMTDTLSLVEADAGEIKGSIGYLAKTADFYEKTIFGTDQF